MLKSHVQIEKKLCQLELVNNVLTVEVSGLCQMVGFQQVNIGRLEKEVTEALCLHDHRINHLEKNFPNVEINGPSNRERFYKNGYSQQKSGDYTTSVGSSASKYTCTGDLDSASYSRELVSGANSKNGTENRRTFHTNKSRKDDTTTLEETSCWT